ncbi:MAG: amidohydrolase family protein [Casimicrobiaceae bacterium]
MTGGQVDAHHHVWSLARGDYGWLTPALAPIHRDFTLDDLAPHVRAAGIATTVLVQAAPTVAETHFLLDVARGSGGLVGGVVGWVDLATDEAVATLTVLARDPHFKSVRPMLQDLPDSAWILRPDVATCLAALPGLGLRLDALVTPRELPALVTMLERHGGLAVVIDHGAKPSIASGKRATWHSRLRELAAHPGVHCKLSGLVTEAAAGWTVEDLRPYADAILAAFGPHRVMWGSDWPVVELAGGYARWRAASVALLADLAPAERAAVLGGTARRFYGLDGSDAGQPPPTTLDGGRHCD